ncbi:MAG: carotenoid biosynthesis protein [Flavobacteriales bacterium]|jgi:putative membrane protein|nr:carotenoid biosynthesis protein [Flavobacteriales bacterium]
MRTLLQRLDPRHGILLVLILHVVGLLALASPLASWVVPLTPVNLVLTAAAMAVFAKLDRRTVLFAFVVGALGYFVEVLGVWTGRVFGEYAYGDVLGFKLLNVPVLIGLNWSMLVFAIGVPLSRTALPVWTKVLAGSLAMVALDLLIEPVAIHLGFWSWEQTAVPVQNYVAWGVVSAVFFTLFFMLPLKRENPLARYVLMAQVIFFAGLNLVLGAG